MSASMFAGVSARGGEQTHRGTGAIMTAQAEVVNGHLAGLLLAMLAVLRRRLVLRVHDGSRRLGC